MFNTKKRPGRTRKALETRARIRESALRLFQKNGFSETTMRQVASSAGVAAGAAYYYFPSKEALVMDFYIDLRRRVDSVARAGMAGLRSLEDRLQALFRSSFAELGPHRRVFAALLRIAADPKSPLSPFGAATRPLRDESIALFQEALEGSDVRVPAELRSNLPRLLWLFQMGIILFWVHDDSPGQSRTRMLTERSVGLISHLIRLSGSHAAAPLRESALEILTAVGGTLF